MATYDNLKGFDSVFENTLCNELQDNIIEFFDWGLLQKGNYQNVTLNEVGPNGENYSKLRISSNPNFPSGQAWEGFRQNWVWQSGINYSPGPLVGNNITKPGISGIYVNNTFYPSSSSGTYAFNVDYNNGRVIFNNPIPTGSTVKAEYSYKYISVIYANNLPWIKEIQYKTLDVPPSFKIQDKGDYIIPPESRVQLPAIAIEIVPKRTMKGYQLGGGQFVNSDVLFHCLAEDEYTRNKLIDIVSLQNDKTIRLFDSNSISNSGDFPYNYMGFPVSGALLYPELLTKHPRGLARIQNANVQNMTLLNSNFYVGIVRMTIETIEPYI